MVSIHIVFSGHSKVTTTLGKNLSSSEKYTWQQNVSKGQGHLPKHLITVEVRVDDRNFKPADPPGKYENA